MTYSPPKTLVKVLQAVTIVCQKNGCEHAATHLFRNTIITAYCEFHAKLEADRNGIHLPMPSTRAQHADGFSVDSTIKRNSVA